MKKNIANSQLVTEALFKTTQKHLEYDAMKSRGHISCVYIVITFSFFPDFLGHDVRVCYMCFSFICVLPSNDLQLYTKRAKQSKNTRREANSENSHIGKKGQKRKIGRFPLSTIAQVSRLYLDFVILPLLLFVPSYLKVCLPAFYPWALRAIGSHFEDVGASLKGQKVRATCLCE